MAKKTMRISVARHTAVAVLGLMLIAVFWASRPQWIPRCVCGSPSVMAR